MMLDRIFIWCGIRDFDLDYELEIFNIGCFLLMLQLRQNYTIMDFNKLLVKQLLVIVVSTFGLHLKEIKKTYSDSCVFLQYLHTQ